MTPTLEERVRELESKMEKILAAKPEIKIDAPWWEQMFGAFKDNPDFEAAMQRGAEYRQTQPNAVDNPEAVEFYR